MLRTTIAVILVAAVVGVAPAAQAGPADGWVMIDTGQFAVPGFDPNPLLDAVLNAVVAAGHGKPCTPKTITVTPGGLSWTKYQQNGTGAIAFEWLAPGSASVSDDCADELNITVQVTDTAPGGSPPSAAGDAGHGSDSTSSGGLYNAAAQSTDFVVYYDLTQAYQRGSAVVEVKVTGTYYNPKAKAWLPLPCKATHTAITPYPTGPQGQTGPVEDCAA